MNHTDIMTVAVSDDTGPICECSIDDFCDANAETLSDVELADLAMLNVGASLAIPVHCGFVTVVRVA